MSKITKEECSDTYGSHDDFMPCPFCGSDHIHHESVRGSRYARCETCSASGGHVFDFQDVEFTRETVLERWNNPVVVENKDKKINQLVMALEDMFLLIEEHGVKSVIRAHATRIQAAQKALNKGDDEWTTALKYLDFQQLSGERRSKGGAS